MANRYWVLGSGNWNPTSTAHWAATSGGVPGVSVPTSADDVVFDANSGATALVKIRVAPATANTITLNKADLTLQHDVGATVAGAVTVTTGTLLTNGQPVSWGSFASAGTLARTITLGSSTITLTAAAACWSVSGSNYTLSAASATFVIAASASTRTFAGAANNYGTLTYTVASTGTLKITGANTFGALNVGAGRTLTLPSSTTTTVVDWNVAGTTGSRVSVNSSTGGTAATLYQPGGTAISNFINLTDIAATGGTWQAGPTATLVSGNSGWALLGATTTPAFAQPIVEIAFANNPSTPLAGLTWVDVTRWCQGISTSTGRTHEGTVRVEAGRMSLRLVNLDGRFSPFNTASPYYGPYTDGADTGVMGLVPTKRIRVRSVYAGVSYPVWCGYVESWNMVWPDEATAYCDVIAVDGFKQLNLRQLHSAYYETILPDGPAMWYRLGDPPGSTVSSTVPGAQAGSTGEMGSVGAGVTLGGGALLPYDPNGSATFDTSAAGAIVASGPVQPLTDFSAEFWLRTTSSVTGQVLLSQNYYSNTSMWAISIVASGLLTFNIAGAIFGNGTSLSNLAPALNDGVLHHVVCTYVASTATSTAYVDGTPVGSATGTTSGAFAGNLMIGAAGVAGETGLVGSIADVALYPYAMSPGSVAAHYNAGTVAFGWQATGARIGGVLDFVGWPAADRHIETGFTPLAPTTLAGSALAAVNAAEDAGAGLFFMGPDGSATFYDRSRTALSAHSVASQVTLGVGAEPYDLAGTAVASDDLDIWNDIVVSRSAGVPQHSFDLVSQARYGQRTMPGLTNLAMASDSDALSMAQYYLSRYKDPVMRVSAVVLHPVSDPATLWPLALGLGLWDRVTVTRAAPGGGSAYSQQANIEKVTHTITETGDWHVTWALSPADIATYWLLGDATYGVLGTSTKCFW